MNDTLLFYSKDTFLLLVPEELFEKLIAASPNVNEVKIMTTTALNEFILAIVSKAEQSNI